MFSSSSQKRRWLFDTQEELLQLRQEAHTAALLRAASRLSLKPEQLQDKALTLEEAQLLVQQYSTVLLNTCRTFQPDLPPSVTATAMHYFRRFYLRRSPIELHPRDILFTCLYMACKVDEFNLPIAQFARNIPRSQEKYVDLILNSELYLIDSLGYDLIVHSPFRALEGLLLQARSLMLDQLAADDLGRKALDFASLSLNSDAGLLYPPSQIALAAFIDSARGLEGFDAKEFVQQHLCDGNSQLASQLLGAVQCIVQLAAAGAAPPAHNEALRSIDTKLTYCRDPRSDPDSELFRSRREAIDELARRL